MNEILFFGWWNLYRHFFPLISLLKLCNIEFRIFWDGNLKVGQGKRLYFTSVNMHSRYNII